MSRMDEGARARPLRPPTPPSTDEDARGNERVALNGGQQQVRECTYGRRGSRLQVIRRPLRHSNGSETKICSPFWLQRLIRKCKDRLMFTFVGKVHYITGHSK